MTDNLILHITSFDELLILMEKSGRDYNIAEIKKAYDVANSMHNEQKRRSGEPYIIHPLSVAAILVELGMDSASVMAGLLHDVIEDTGYTEKDMIRDFGVEVEKLVDGVTKLNKIPFSSREEQQAENIRKMLISMAEDIRVIIIKFADRMHNLSTLEYVSPQKQRDKALECLEVYAPIAHRLGIRTVKEYMEDISLKYLDPVAYHEIEEDLASRTDQRKVFVESTLEVIRDRIKITMPDVHIEGRAKSIYGIYRKMFIQNKSFDEIYDVFAIRIIVDTIEDCYNVLGIIHDMFQPLPNRFKDYISMPKPNMYQSLHTTVLDKKGVPLEVQIRTWDMHHTAEYGIAAHWKYKLGMSAKDSVSKDNLDNRLSWIRQMLENQAESSDVTDIIYSIKSDLLPEEVFVFTPKGDVKNLPLGSTVIDFAYAIHSEVGNRMIGAKVDGRMVPLDYKVKTGEIIEVLTTKEAGKGPNRDWLNIVRSSEARNKIRTWFKKEKREDNIIEGKTELEKEYKRNSIVNSEELEKFVIEQVGRRYSCNTMDDFYAAVGYGGIQLWKVMPRIKEEYQKIKKSQNPVENPEDFIVEAHHHKGKAASGVIVDGIDNCLIKFSRCCNPLPGDSIIGFITRGFGVSIHKRGCANVPEDLSQSPEPERWVSVHWTDDIKDDFKSTLHIIAQDREGLLADITQTLFNMHIFIDSLNSRQDRASGNAIISASITIKGLDQLEIIIDRIKKIKGVIAIDRS